MQLSTGLFYVDLEFLGRPRAIATMVMHGPGGVALVDPGPTTCLPTLEARLAERGIRFADVTDILITHIHLDHSGSVGAILRAHPTITVWVHERGLPHVADPGKLIESASRLYGADMARLWGDIVAVPFERLRSLSGGERIVAAGRTLDVAYTPGHASHHVSYFDADSGVAMVGDVAGVRIGGGFVLPPTPPPDINLEVWPESAARIRIWSPRTLFLTHFGPIDTPEPHWETLFENLRMTSGWVGASLQESGTDEEHAARFSLRLTEHMRRVLSPEEMAAYPVAAPFEHLWMGLARYHRKKATR